MWKSKLILNNKITGQYTKLKFKYPCLYTYNDIYNNLSKIFNAIYWDYNYTKKNIRFKLCGFETNSVIIKRWENYLVHEDKIQITIFDPNERIYILYTERGKKLMKVSNINIIYKTLKLNKLDQTLLIYLCDVNKTKLKLIDVIDTPKLHYNKLIDRMVYNFGHKRLNSF